MLNYYIVLLLMTVIGSIAAFFLKKASISKGIIALIKNPNIYIGAFLYILSAIMNIYVLRYLDYAIVLPMTSFTYVWTILFSKLFLNENINFKKSVGVFCIVLGTVFLVLF